MFQVSADRQQKEAECCVQQGQGRDGSYFSKHFPVCEAM